MMESNDDGLPELKMESNGLMMENLPKRYPQNIFAKLATKLRKKNTIQLSTFTKPFRPMVKQCKTVN